MIISSRANPKIKQIRALHQRKEREATGMFIVEGIAHVTSAVEANAQIEYLCYAPDLLTSPFAQEMIERESLSGLACYDVAADVFETISDKENPSGIIAVVHKPKTNLQSLISNPQSLFVALVAPQDPGNIGTILRTMDAVNASGLILVDGGTDAYHPTAVRASMGAVFTQKIVATTFNELAYWGKANPCCIVGTSAKATNDYRNAKYVFPSILLLGSEQKGLSEEHLVICDQTVNLPMMGKVSSLNLAVAAGIMMYEVIGQRGLKS
ncbi:MAG: RNA methyltransferase [Chloroflexi bacterium]|nr:RNA methyltransferase [Chloroflexota bacterium]